MKRAELEIGMEVGITTPRNRRYPKKAIVMDTEPWRNGEGWRQTKRRTDKGNGVAIAATWDNGKSWYPDVVMLGHLSPWSEAEATADEIKKANKEAYDRRVESDNIRKAATLKLRELASELNVSGYISEYSDIPATMALALVEAALTFNPEHVRVGA